MKILTPISLGELYDKISILEIKLANMDTPEKIVNVTNEYKELRKIAEKYPIDDDFYVRLLKVNNNIWVIEDRIRVMEKLKTFNREFVEVARLVYHRNDERSAIKKEINLKYGSDVIEEKSYEKY